MKYNFRLIAINEKFNEIEYDYPILDRETKNKIIVKFKITFESLLDKQEYKELIVHYAHSSRRLLRPVKKMKNFLSYSIKEYNLKKEDILFILNLLSDEEIFHVNTEELIWKLCIIKSIKEEFLE